VKVDSTFGANSSANITTTPVLNSSGAFRILPLFELFSAIVVLFYFVGAFQ